MFVDNRSDDDDREDSTAKIQECAAEISQLLTERYREEGTGGLNAETFLATSAALTGVFIRSCWGNLKTNNQKKEAKNFLSGMTNSLNNLFQSAGISPESLPDFTTYLKRVLGNPNYKTHLILTNNPYYDPHEAPEFGAAVLREEINYIHTKLNMSDGEVVAASMLATLRAAMGVLEVMPPSVVHNMVMETVIGTTYMEPVDRKVVPRLRPLTITPRIVGAGERITDILLKQSFALAAGRPPHPSNLAAKAGALLGEMTHRAGISQEVTADYITAPVLDEFLKECNIIFMASYIRRGGDAKTLPEYGEYVANAAASIGHDPYPKHNVPAQYLPSTFPAAEAAMAREAIMEISEEFHLLDWERAAASAVATNDMIRLAELKISTLCAFRLAMEEATAYSRVKPIDLDKILKNAPTDIRDSMNKMRKTASDAVKNGYAYKLQDLVR